MCLKLIGLGVTEYFEDGWNRFDCVIVLVSLLEISVQEYVQLNVTMFRALRLLRLLKLVR